MEYDFDKRLLQHAYKILAPGIDKMGPCADVIEFHTACGHANEGLVRDTAARMGAALRVRLELCRDCLQVKGFEGYPIVCNNLVREEFRQSVY